jgi:hypothetical protein
MKEDASRSVAAQKGAGRFAIPVNKLFQAICLHARPFLSPVLPGTARPGKEAWGGLARLSGYRQGYCVLLRTGFEPRPGISRRYIVVNLVTLYTIVVAPLEHKHEPFGNSQVNICVCRRRHLGLDGLWTRRPFLFFFSFPFIFSVISFLSLSFFPVPFSTSAWDSLSIMNLLMQHGGNGRIDMILRADYEEQLDAAGGFPQVQRAPSNVTALEACPDHLSHAMHPLEHASVQKNACVYAIFLKLVCHQEVY